MECIKKIFLSLFMLSVWFSTNLQAGDGAGGKLGDAAALEDKVAQNKAALKHLYPELTQEEIKGILGLSGKPSKPNNKAGDYTNWADYALAPAWEPSVDVASDEPLSAESTTSDMASLFQDLSADEQTQTVIGLEPEKPGASATARRRTGRSAKLAGLRFNDSDSNQAIGAQVDSQPSVSGTGAADVTVSQPEENTVAARMKKLAAAGGAGTTNVFAGSAAQKEFLARKKAREEAARLAAEGQFVQPIAAGAGAGGAAADAGSGSSYDLSGESASNRSLDDDLGDSQVAPIATKPVDGKPEIVMIEFGDLKNVVKVEAVLLANRAATYGEVVNNKWKDKYDQAMRFVDISIDDL